MGGGSGDAPPGKIRSERRESRLLGMIAYVISKENRIYIRVEFRQSLGMNFVSPFQPEREFKVYKSCKFSQIICSRVH